MIGPAELIIIIMIMGVPVIILGAMILFFSGSKHRGAGGSPDEDLTQVLRDLNAGLARMEERMTSVEEVLGAHGRNKN